LSEPTWEAFFPPAPLFLWTVIIFFLSFFNHHIENFYPGVLVI
jgi:hypothetical protein